MAVECNATRHSHAPLGADPLLSPLALPPAPRALNDASAFLPAQLPLENGHQGAGVLRRVVDASSSEEHGSRLREGVQDRVVRESASPEEPIEIGHDDGAGPSGPEIAKDLGEARVRQHRGA